MRARVGALLILAAFGLAAVETRADENWPQWRGRNRNGVADEQGLLQRWPEGGPPLAWSASGLGGGFSSLAVVDGRVFTLGDMEDGQQYVVAVDAADGSRLWRTRLGRAHRSDPQRPGARSTPTVDGDRVYAISTDGDLVCLDAASGALRWRRHLVEDFGGRMMSQWKFSESPLVDGDRVIATPGARDAMLVALDKSSGEEIWRSAVPDLGPRGRDGAGYSSIVISEGAGVRQYVQLTGRGLVGVRASDGRFLWSYNRVANDTANISTPVVRGDLVFASTGYQTGSALLRLEASAGGVAAREVYFLPSTDFQNHHGGLVLVGDHVYAGHGHNRGFPICISLETGEIAWGGAIRNGGTGTAAVVYADGRLYYRYQNGRMLLIEATPEGYREHGSFEIPDVSMPSWSHPVVVAGRLYLREQDRLHSYDLRRR